MKTTIAALRDNPTRRGMLASIIEASLFNVWATAVGGSFLTGFAIYLGADGFHLGILAGLPSFSTMLQLLCAPFVVGLVRRRNFLAGFSGAQRIGSSLAGLAALWLMPSPVALWFFIIAQMIAWALMAPPTVVWNGYMSDLVPPDVRGQYFARRSFWSGIVSMLIVLLYGWLLDVMPGAPGFRILYLLALVGALGNLGAWFLHPELPQGDRKTARSFWESIRTPLLKPGPHRPATLFFAAWAFAQGIAAPFYAVVLLEKLSISYGTVSLLLTIQSLTGILTAQFWGRYQDRVGQAKVIGIVSGIIALVPLLYLGARWGGLPMLIAASVLQGTAANAMGLANQTLNMRLAPAEDRGSYFAFFGVASGLMGFFTPMLMGPLTEGHMDLLLIGGSVASAVLCLVWRTKLARLITH
ncbi:MAG TPA: MFS transporter [Symbiobacteriaceae bacterium]|jgi:MFS family permease|nr:MFS transporter [Symbiobacteriaceae bacterium]